ncbi:hypothetical protein EIP87_33865 (plasmid) [Pseudomonas aeruginosa]|nr:hypothetical protein EIP87_33865 [Pseudomonas aeruginosa]
MRSALEPRCLQARRIRTVRKFYFRCIIISDSSKHSHIRVEPESSGFSQEVPMQMFWTLFAILGLAASVFLGNIQDWRDTETQGEIAAIAGSMQVYRGR